MRYGAMVERRKDKCPLFTFVCSYSIAFKHFDHLDVSLLLGPKALRFWNYLAGYIRLGYIQLILYFLLDHCLFNFNLKFGV